MLDIIRPYQITACILAALAMYVVVRSLRGGRDLRWSFYVGLSVICGEILLLRMIPPHQYESFSLHWTLAIASMLFAAMAIAVDQNNPEHLLDRSRSRAQYFYLVATSLLVTLFLLFDLGGFAGSLLTWESPVSRSYINLFLTGQTRVSFALGRLRWDDGLLSEGQASLFYGAPTYVVLTSFGFTPSNLRIVSVILALLSVWVLYRLASRFFGAFVGVAASVVLALNPAFLYYARYGSSIAGTVCAALVACYATWSFLEDPEPSAWKASVCLVSLYLATLNYATARLFVVVLLLTIVSVPVLQRKRLTRRGAVGVAIIVVGSLGIALSEWWYGGHRSVLSARGEHFFHFLEDPYYVSQYLGRQVPVDRLSATDKFAMLARVLAQTLPQYLGFLSPYARIDPEGRGVVWIGDVPNLRLYDAALFPFICLGLMAALRKYRSWSAWSLVLCFTVGSLALLLTTRVDTHRMVLLVIPLSVWAAVGIKIMYETFRQAGTKGAVLHTLAVALLASMCLSGLRILFMETPLPPVSQALAEVIDTIPGPRAAGGRIDHKDLAWVNLAVVERIRTTGRGSFRVLDAVGDQLANDAIAARGVDREALAALERELSRATVVLTPGRDYTVLQRIARDRGYLAVIKESRGLQFLVITR